VTDTGWHIYWQNPGDSGEPPRTQWKLPAGVTIGALEWPTPMRLSTAVGTDYGYQGTTVLFSSLQIPATAQPGNIEVGLDLRWLACHDVCIPQHTRLKTPLRIANAASIHYSAHQILQSAAERLPKPLPPSYRPMATILPNSFLLTFVSSEPITKAEFFPAEVEQIENSAPQELASHGKNKSLTLKKSQYFRQEPQSLKGVLVINGRDAYQVDAPIQSSIKIRRSHQK